MFPVDFKDNKRTRSASKTKLLSKDILGESLEKHYRYGGDWITRYLHRQRVDHLAELIGKYPEGATALDVGCGSGIYTIVLAAESFLTVGIDISRKALLTAREWAESEGIRNNVYLINCSAEFLPLRNNSFNLIVCSELIEHLDIPDNGVKEISRVLNCPGNAILTLPNLSSYYWMRFRFSYLLLRFLGRKRNIVMERHTSFPFWRTLRLVRKEGLLVSQVTSTNIIPLPFSIWRNLVERYPNIINSFERIEKKLAEKTPFRFLGSSLIVIVMRSAYKKNC